MLQTAIRLGNGDFKVWWCLSGLSGERLWRQGVGIGPKGVPYLPLNSLFCLNAGLFPWIQYVKYVGYSCTPGSGNFRNRRIPTREKRVNTHTPTFMTPQRYQISANSWCRSFIYPGRVLRFALLFLIRGYEFTKDTLDVCGKFFNLFYCFYHGDLKRKTLYHQISARNILDCSHGGGGVTCNKIFFLSTTYNIFNWLTYIIAWIIYKKKWIFC